MNSGNILALRTFGRFTYVFIGDFPQVTAFIAAKDGLGFSRGVRLLVEAGPMERLSFRLKITIGSSENGF